jgi:hypothetical protein
MAIKQEESSINKKFQHNTIDSDKERRSRELVSLTSSEDSPSPNGMQKTTQPSSLTENTTIKRTTTTATTSSSMVSSNTNTTTTTDNKIVKFAMNYMGIANTAATGNYITTDCPVTDKHPTSNSIDVTLPNGVNITSSHTAILQLPHELPIGACKADIFPGLKSGSLVSISQLCDHGCMAMFTATPVRIFHQGRLILTGHRSIDTNNLWLLQLDGMLPHQDHVPWDTKSFPRPSNQPSVQQI